jgi:ATP-dependent DNA ligase
LTERHARLHPAEGETLIRLLAGDLGLGIDDNLLSQAVATAFKADSGRVLEAIRQTGDPSQVAILTKENRLGEVS